MPRRERYCIISSFLGKSVCSLSVQHREIRLLICHRCHFRFSLARSGDNGPGLSFRDPPTSRSIKVGYCTRGRWGTQSSTPCSQKGLPRKFADPECLPLRSLGRREPNLCAQSLRVDQLCRVVRLPASRSSSVLVMKRKLMSPLPR